MTCHVVIYCVLIVLICWCPCLLCSCSSVFVIIDCYFLLCWCKLYFPVAVAAAENSPGTYNSFLSLSCERIFAILLIFILCVRVFYLHYMHSVSAEARRGYPLELESQMVVSYVGARNDTQVLCSHWAISPAPYLLILKLFLPSPFANQSLWNSD